MLSILSIPSVPSIFICHLLGLFAALVAGSLGRLLAWYLGLQYLARQTRIWFVRFLFDFLACSIRFRAAMVCTTCLGSAVKSGYGTVVYLYSTFVAGVMSANLTSVIFSSLRLGCCCRWALVNMLVDASGCPISFSLFLSLPLA